MSIQTTALKYGWSIVAGAVLTGATIFTADSTLKYITQRDAIQVILGTVERCLATQTGTKADGTAIYAVSPPSFVRSWVTTNGLTGTNFAWVTNHVTNSISRYTDRAMMVDLDAKILALIPYYVDTNTVYDGSTNIVMLTVTGLFASLQIGDHTNQFTAIPAWVGTNGVTNAATFGPWAWRNYVVAWQERYKVLEALKITVSSLDNSDKKTLSVSSGFAMGGYPDRSELVNKCEECWINKANTNSHVYPWYDYISVSSSSESNVPWSGFLSFYSIGIGWSYYLNPGLISYSALDSYGVSALFGATVNTNLGGSLRIYTCSVDNPVTPSTYTWDDNGFPVTSDYGQWKLLETISYAQSNVTVRGINWIDFNLSDHFPTLSGIATTNDPSYSLGGFIYWRKSKGFKCSIVGLLQPTFNYCTNKFW